ncbi:LysR substrate-binding domain-containing protein [Scytonema sp. NUACC26]|uniref:LysR substrate-binding domain-containing protein n=1 Tax=Scytonema sp. NUACC26 TaxID=3140176 RepID=UPI0034DC7B6D
MRFGFSRYASRISLGLGYSVLPDYLCKEWIAENRLTLVLKPTLAVTNHIWLAYRKSERQSQQTAMLLNLLESASKVVNS